MRNRSSSKGIRLDKNLLRSENFRTLTRWSMLVYLDFLRRRKMVSVKRNGRSKEWIIENNGEIVYPYAEAERKGIGPREFRNALDELIERGFLDITHLGSGGRSGDMTKYFIDDRWKDYGKPEFRPAKQPRVKDSRGGRGWKAYNEKNRPSMTNMTAKTPLSIDKSATPNRKNKQSSIDKSVTPKRREYSLSA